VRPRRFVREESGSVLVLVAFWLPVMILFGSFVVDVGNWFTHQRHLQTQADAAALAGGDGFVLPCTSGTNGTIESLARNYAGKSATTPAAQYNDQIGFTPPPNIHVVLNSSRFFNEPPTPPDTGPPPETGYGDLGFPCDAAFLDVKMTESNLPWYFAGGNFVPAINAHARVSLFKETAKSGTIPVAVPDPGTVTAAAVDFVDEDSGTVLGSSSLSAAGGGAYNNSSTPVSVNMSGVVHLGAVMKLSGATPPPATLTCGQPLVLCYDLSSVNTSGVPSRGVVFAQGYPTAGYSTAPGEPVVKRVELQIPGGGCSSSSAYFFYLTSGTCQLRVRADVAFSDATGNNRSVSATISDLNGAYSDTEGLKNVTTGPFGATDWESDGTGQAKYFNVPAQAGALNVTLSWSKKQGTARGVACTPSSPCSGTWSGRIFQRTMSGTDPSSGPIASMVLNEGAGPSPESYINDGASTTHSLWVNVQMQPALGYATGVSSPPVYLRVEGNQNQTIDCDPNRPNLRQELDFGCGPTYTINTVSGGAFSTDCSTWPTSNNSWTPPAFAQPWPCVTVQTGGAGGQVASGIEDRMVRLSGGTCPANNWTSFPTFAANDPRLVSVILTPFGTFGGNGNTNIPVTGFAEFYITGWANTSGGRVRADCTGDDTPPGADYIVGHFIRYIDTIDTGGGTVPCDPTSPTLGNCVVVLNQ
jgi:hypothetical protein